jgi:hypothetical protein
VYVKTPKGGGTDGVLQYNDDERHVLELGKWNDDWKLNHDRWADDWNSDNRFLATPQC